MKALLIVVATLCQVAPPGDEPRLPDEMAAEARGKPPALQERLRRLLDNIQSLGPWEEQYEYILDSVEKVYERNGWVSESDRFSLDLIREVSAIPPWNLQERFDTVAGRVSDRYLLDEEQETALRRTLARESMGLFARQMGQIMQYAPEMLATRAAGEAITPEQVARWTRLASPVMEDARQRLNAASAEFIDQLDPEQRELAQRDMDATNRRMDRINELGQSWMRGEWDAGDWGLDEDPIQLAGEARAAGLSQREVEEALALATERRDVRARVRAEPANGSVATGPPEPAAGRETNVPAAKPPEPSRGRTGIATSAPEVSTEPSANDPWAQYVRAFIRKYKLSDAQQQRAWSMYREAKSRADRLRERYGEQADSWRQRQTTTQDDRARESLERQAARQQASLDRLFGQLKRRLDRLPTRAQRRAPEPIEIPGEPTKPAEPQPQERN